ncbi:hypothetical protein FF2_040120 [Malus domestica]
MSKSKITKMLHMIMPIQLLKMKKEKSYKKQCELNAINKETTEKIKEKFQALKAKKISLEELVKKQQEEIYELNKSMGFIYELNKSMGFIYEVETEKEKKTEKPVHQDSATDSTTESEAIKIEDKIVIVLIKKWISSQNRFCMKGNL